MKRSLIMKSNISVQQRNRPEPEGRLFPRRKVASKSLLLNGGGDFDMELSLAIQESLKYAQQGSNDGQSQVENAGSIGFCNKRRDSSEHKQIANKTVSAVPISASVFAPASDFTNEEVGRLKDLVLAQAELIQCQQEELIKKDREIQDLLTGKDALQCRLERMERRMSILKPRNDSQDKCTPREGLISVSGAAQPGAAHRGNSETSNRELKRKRRTKFLFSHKKHHKPLTPTTEVESASEQEETEDEEEDDEEEDNGSADTAEEDHSSTEDGEESEKENKAGVPSPEVVEKIIDYPIMQTGTLYHLYYPKHVLATIDTSTVPERPSQLDVETPSFRLKPFTNMYQLEGTENITDEAYYKRHQKYEQEEKRRKRWDLQRIRELKSFETFQRQKDEEMRASQDEADVETFLPSIHDLKHIEMTDSLPVMAFGQPVPYVCPAEFEIPWEVSSSSVASTSAYRHKNSGHSKRH